MKNRLVCDLHMHTIASGHAYGTIREMAVAAKDANLKLIGISEHGPGIPGTCSTFYFGNLGSVAKVIDGVEVIHSSEINVNNQGEPILERMRLNALDYLIVGIHCVNDLYEDQGIAKNTANLIKCMKHPKVRIISHPDTNDTPLDYDALAKAAKENGVALELNNSSLKNPPRRPGCLENYRNMLAACMKYRCNIVIDSDAHDPSAVGKFDEAIAFLDTVDFDEELILNTSVDKFKAFISQEK